MAEGYIVVECLMFASCYLDVVKMCKICEARNKKERSDPLYGGTVVQISRDELDKVHQWIIIIPFDKRSNMLTNNDTYILDINETIYLTRNGMPFLG